jgi:ABC-type branched-subunit amino acid transport system substrate-binding protein
MNVLFLAFCGLLASAVAVLGDEAAIIGALLPPEEAEAASLREGLELAVQQANKAHPGAVRLVIRGRTGQWGADAVEAARLVLDDEVQVLVAPPNGAASHLALQVSGRTAIPVITLCPDSSVTHTGVPWMIRIVPQTTDEAWILFASIANSNGINPARCAVVVPEGRSGREIARDLKKAADASGCVAKDIFELKLPDVTREFVSGLVTNHPAAVLLWVDAKLAAALAKTLRASGYKGILAGPSLLRTTDFLSAAAQAAEGFITSEILLDGPSKAVAEAFAGAFEKRWGHKPTPTAAMAYDAMQVALRILKEHRPGSVRRAFPLEFTMRGVSGPLRFDPDGNRKATLRILAAHEHCFAPR